MMTVFAQILRILDESAAYLLLGFALAGLMHVLLSRFPRLAALFAGRGVRPVVRSALLGLPLPLCSCSVLPAAMSLRRGGAGKGSTASFLISVPETDVVSILLTLALLGPALAIFRPLAALATAIGTGLLINALEARGGEGDRPPSAPSACPSCAGESPSILPAPGRGNWILRMFRYGFVKVFDDIIAQFVLGIVAAGVLMVWLPEIDLTNLPGGAPVVYAAMLAVGVPAYVCAVASTPVAVGLLVGGVSPGAVLVFLLAGPATNLASLFVLRGEFGGRLLAVYLIGIGVFSVTAGILFDVFFAGAVDAGSAAVRHAAHATSPADRLATIVFGILVARSFWRTRLFSRGFRRIFSRSTSSG